MFLVWSNFQNPAIILGNTVPRFFTFESCNWNSNFRRIPNEKQTYLLHSCIDLIFFFFFLSVCFGSQWIKIKQVTQFYWRNQSPTVVFIKPFQKILKQCNYLYWNTMIYDIRSVCGRNCDFFFFNLWTKCQLYTEICFLIFFIYGLMNLQSDLYVYIVNSLRQKYWMW